jgi:cytochrome c-L
MNKHRIAAFVGIFGLVGGLGGVAAQEVFRHTITGEQLDLNLSPKEGRDTPAVKKFIETGVNPYTEVKGCLPKGEEVYLVSCSGCHGHLAEGKVGPGLNDAYWTYPKNKTDKGLFETIFGGAQGMMGPHGQDIPMDEMLKLMAWIRHLYTGDTKDADWLTDAQKKAFKPYVDPGHGDDGEPKKTAATTEECKVPAN